MTKTQGGPALKAIEFGAFFTYFHLLGKLKWHNFFKKLPEHVIFDKLSDKTNCLKIALQVSKLGF